jgi:hypothetical protein
VTSKCICGEINARHCQVHQEEGLRSSVPLPQREYFLKELLQIEPAYVYTSDEDLYQKIQQLSFK